MQGAQDYTVQPGDNLSKISKHFYGDANKYPVIAKANNLADPDKIKVGQKLVIPRSVNRRRTRSDLRTSERWDLFLRLAGGRLSSTCGF